MYKHRPLPGPDNPTELAGGVLASNGRCPSCAKRGLVIQNVGYDTVNTFCAQSHCDKCGKAFVLTYVLHKATPISKESFKKGEQAYV